MKKTFKEIMSMTENEYQDYEKSLVKEASNGAYTKAKDKYDKKLADKELILKEEVTKQGELSVDEKLNDFKVKWIKEQNDAKNEADIYQTRKSLLKGKVDNDFIDLVISKNKDNEELWNEAGVNKFIADNQKYVVSSTEQTSLSGVKTSNQNKSNDPMEQLSSLEEDII